MPRVWIDYCQFMVSQCKITRSRRTFDRALRALPITQHPRIWPLYLRFARNLPLPETAIRVYRRYLKVNVGRYAGNQKRDLNLIVYISWRVKLCALRCKLLKLSIRFLFLCPLCSCHLRMQRNTLITCVQLDVWMKLRSGWQLWSMMKTLFLKRESPIIRLANNRFYFFFFFFTEFVHLYIWGVNTLLFTILGWLHYYFYFF